MRPWAVRAVERRIVVGGQMRSGGEFCKPGSRTIHLEGKTMRALLNSFITDESGQGLVEYALIIALVAIGLIAILVLFRNAIGNVFNESKNRLNNAPAGSY